MEVGEAYFRLNQLFLFVNSVLKERKINQFVLYL